MNQQNKNQLSNVNCQSSIVKCQLSTVNRKGFSLMELLIVIAIIGIMTAVLLVNLSGSRSQKQVEAAAREVAAAIREAQNNALTGKNVTTGCSYIFTYNSGSSSYGISSCSNINYTLSNGVIFNNGNNFTFSVPFGTVSGGYATPIVIRKGTSQYTICVNSAGNVTEKSGNTLCP